MCSEKGKKILLVVLSRAKQLLIHQYNLPFDLNQ